MEECIKIIVLGEVQSQLRPIFKPSLVDAKVVDGVLVDYKLSGTAIDPPKCRAYKKKVSETAKSYYAGELLDEPLGVEIEVYMGVTKSWSKKKKAQALANEIMPTYKKDADNMTKPLLDGLTGVVWKDDGCIVDLKFKKRYSSVPRAEIRISTIK